MRKRSRSTTATRHPVVPADILSTSSAPSHSPPLKKRAGATDNRVCVSGGHDTTAAPSQVGSEVPLSGATPSVSSSSSDVASATAQVGEEGPREGGGFARAGLKRSRHSNNNDHDNSWSDSSVSLRSSTRRRGEGSALLDNSRPSSSTIAGPAVPTTNRTLVYDAGGTTPPRPDTALGNATLSRSAAVSSPRPPRRNVVLLTSTPLFLRHDKQQDTGGDNEGPPSSDVHSPTAAMASPLRLMRAAQELLSPARLTLLQGLSHLRQSVTGTATSSTRPTALRRGTDASTPPPPSPWGRLSSIHPARDALPSLSADPRGDESTQRSRGRQRSQPVASAPTLLSFCVSSISGSRRSSVSEADMRGVNAGAVRGGEEEQRRLTIQRDCEEARGSSASVRTASLSSFRMSSPTVRGVEETGNNTAYPRHRRCHQHHHNANEFMDPRIEGTHRGGGAALVGPYNARYASVSSLSGSLTNVVSSSRSTAQSSLTSADAAAGEGAHPKGYVSAVRDASADAALPRRSSALMDPNLSSILPDEEEQAIRRRMQRHGHGRSQVKSAPAQESLAPQHAAANVLELPSIRPPVTGEPSTDCPARRGKTSRTSVRFASHAGRAVHSSGGWEGTSSTDRQRQEHHPVCAVRFSTPLRHFMGRTTRVMVGLCAVMAAVWCIAATAWPLMALQAPYGGYQDESFTAAAAVPPSAAAVVAFRDTHVNPVSDLQALYQIAPASLNAEGVDRLRRRALSEGVERLERATQHLTPQDNTPPPHRLFYYRAMIYAYVAVQRNSELYARSRDASPWRRLFCYPLADVLKYGFYRFGSLTRSVSLTQRFARDWQDRIFTSVACSAQSEFVRCPSLLYVEEAMARAAAPFLYTDANDLYEASQRRRQLRQWRTRLHRDWGSEVYMETLLSYIRSGVQETTRDYNG